MRFGALLVALTVASCAYASGPFDGNWTGGGTPTSSCGALTVELTIANSLVSGTAHGTTEKGEPVSGHFLPGMVQPDGTASLLLGYQTHFPASFRFTADRFTASIAGYCGQRPVTGTRVK